jgi:hypothetical protein
VIEITLQPRGEFNAVEMWERELPLCHLEFYYIFTKTGFHVT